MKQHRFLISWIIIGVTIPLLGTLAWNQFNWLQELQNREKHRIELSMIKSAQTLSKRLQEELFFLPSLLRIRQEEKGEIEAIFSERLQFWNYYALFPSLLKYVLLINDKNELLSKWNATGRNTTTNLSSIEFHNEPRFTDTDNEIQIISSITGSTENRIRILCVFDKHVLFTNVIPSIAEKSLDITPLYAYRIIDRRTGSLVYTSVQSYSQNLFATPDIEIPLFEQMRLPSFHQPPDFMTTRLPDKYYESFSFIKERIKIDPSFRPDDKDALIFPYLMLQIVNKDRSLADLSKQTTIQNALISFGTVLLLALVMIVLAEATRRSRALARSQQEFIATITHELKTPLSVISSAAQNLSDGLIRDSKKVEQYGAMIKKDAGRLALSIEHFLLYSNTHSVTPLNPVLCNVNELIQTALNFTEPDRLRYDFRTEVSLYDKPLFIRGDKLALESVLQNLVQNVLKHAHDGRYLGIIVTLSTKNNAKNHKKNQEMIIIKIRDKGPGITHSEQKRIFEPFVRGKRAMKEQIPGNGIGLNLVRRIVTIHGGTVQLESRPERGSTFIITLPVCEGEEIAD